METYELSIDGISCGHCVARVTRALAGVRGVKVEQVSVGSARISIDPQVAEIKQVAAVLTTLAIP